MEMRFYVGTDPAVEERNHAYYQEKLFLMAEGTQKTPEIKKNPTTKKTPTTNPTKQALFRRAL